MTENAKSGLSRAVTSILFLMFLLSNPCFAGLSDVKSIVITPSKLNKSRWLQVSEVVAVQSKTGADLALKSVGASSSSSSSYSKAANHSHVISGVAPDSYPRIYHSKTNDGSAWVKVTLNKASELDSVIIYGRANGHSSRDVYDVYLFNVAGKIIHKKAHLNADNQSHSVRVDFVSHPVKRVDNKKGMQPQSNARHIAKKAKTSTSNSPKSSDLRKLLREGTTAKNKRNYALAKSKFQEILSYDVTHKTKRIHNTAKSKLAMLEIYEKNAPQVRLNKKVKPISAKKSQTIYSDEKLKELDQKATKVHLYDNDIAQAKKIYTDIMEHSEKGSAQYYSAKRELDGINESERSKKQKAQYAKQNPKPNSDMNLGKFLNVMGSQPILKDAFDGIKQRKIKAKEEAAKEEAWVKTLTESTPYSSYGISFGETTKKQLKNSYMKLVLDTFEDRHSRFKKAHITESILSDNKTEKVCFVYRSYTTVGQEDCFFVQNDIVKGMARNLSQNKCLKSCGLHSTLSTRLVQHKFKENISKLGGVIVKNYKRNKESAVLKIYSSSVTTVSTPKPFSALRDYKYYANINASLCLFPDDMKETIINNKINYCTI